MPEETKAKFAAEAWELVRLFSRLGKTAYGLLILLVGWLLLIQAGREVLQSKEAVPGLWGEPPLSLVAVIGLGVLTFWWFFYSRLWVFVWAAILQLLKPGMYVLAFGVPLVLGLVNLVLLPVTLPLKNLILRSRRRQFRENWIKKWHGEDSPDAAEKAWQDHLTAIVKEHGAAAVEKAVTKGTWEPSSFMIAEGGARLAGRLMGLALSRSRVGLAPITPQSYVEEFLAAKLPLQVFAQAIMRIRRELGEMAMLDRIQLIELPASAKPQQSAQARRYASLFDADVLLWGTYKAGEERVISMNLLSRFPPQKEEERDQYGSAYQRRIFPWELQLEIPAVSFDQDDEEAVYLALVVAEILALQQARKRWERGWRKFLSDFRALDRLSLYAEETIEEILLRVIPTALARMGDKALPERYPMTSRHALVEVAGQWLGKTLTQRRWRGGFEELAKRKGKQQVIEQLTRLAEACVRLEPRNALGHYRLGALHVLGNSKRQAVRSFRQAGELEKDTFEVHEIGARVAADMAVGRGDDDDTGLAVWAAHAACAINTGSEYAIRNVREMVEKTLPEKLYYAALKKPEPVAVTVIKEMLPEA